TSPQNCASPGSPSIFRPAIDGAPLCPLRRQRRGAAVRMTAAKTRVNAQFARCVRDRTARAAFGGAPSLLVAGGACDVRRYFFCAMCRAYCLEDSYYIWVYVGSR